MASPSLYQALLRALNTLVPLKGAICSIMPHQGDWRGVGAPSSLILEAQPYAVLFGRLGYEYLEMLTWLRTRNSSPDYQVQGRFGVVYFTSF